MTETKIEIAPDDVDESVIWVSTSINEKQWSSIPVAAESISKLVGRVIKFAADYAEKTKSETYKPSCLLFSSLLKKVRYVIGEQSDKNGLSVWYGPCFEIAEVLECKGRTKYTRIVRIGVNDTKTVLWSWDPTQELWRRRKEEVE